MSGLMPAGALNRNIVLRTYTKTQNETTGEEIRTPDDGVTLPAAWLPAGTREAYQAQQRLGAYIDGMFRIRYRTRPEPELNDIVWEGRTYDLKPAVEVGVKEGWEVPVVARGESV